MFTWIIEHTSKIIAIDHGEFTIENNFTDPLTIGKSIAHDGACMTVTQWNEKTYKFFAMEESLSTSTLWTKKVGDYLNIERCLQVGDRLDGHFVTWHVETVADVSKIDIHEDNSRTVRISYETSFDRLVIEKWSICLNGVSLTVVETTTWWCSVCIIPHTLEVTTLWTLKPWNTLNVEFDILAKYVQKSLT